MQNRLRNYVRDTTKRRERMDIRTESSIEISEASFLEAVTIDGRRIEAVRDGRKRIINNR